VTPSNKEDMSKDAFRTFEACNFPEDYDQENGNYINTCSICNFNFRGNKHRFVCKMCDGSEPDWGKMILKKAPDLPGAYAGCWLDGEMTGYARCMVKHVKPLQQRIKELEAEREKDMIEFAT
jgi:hypothetical protein